VIRDSGQAHLGGGAISLPTRTAHEVSTRGSRRCATRLVLVIANGAYFGG
jgi:hypothetical protein